ncbi:MAG: DUF433 domain-containing protein [Planctomycetes bacterium]|nr:DUF433 domain-containing protein [Planctomycetota bacterium]MBL7038680.1 DUF433 domain-containing protein [Pirellulaceae bacterium]
MNLPDFLTQDPDGYIHLTGHRIGLQHLMYYYNEGYSAEMLVCEYPALSLAAVHKVIAFYLENAAEVDEYVTTCQAAIALLRAGAGEGPPVAELRRRMERLRQVEGVQGHARQ